jgi:D-arginine dehydrogenase
MVDQISYDIVIVGAGIAGASVAAALGDGINVALVEQEQQPGYHSTGRSAAIYSPT